MNKSFSNDRRYYRVLMLISIVAIGILEILMYFISFKNDGFTWESYYRFYFLMPSLLNGGLYVLVTLMLRSPDVSEMTKNYICVLYMVAVCTIVSTIHCKTPVVVGSLSVPVIWSTIYGNKRLHRITYGIALLCAMSLFVTTRWIVTCDPNMRENLMIAVCFLAVVEIPSMYLMRVVDNTNCMLVSREEDHLSLEKKLLRDPMTGLYNHTAFYEFLDRCNRQRGEKPLSLAVIDIDNFKKVNDTYGHSNGDIVILKLAAILQKHAPENSYVCRYGGEEFAIVFPDTKSKCASEIMNGILEEFRDCRYEWNPNEQITFSCGIFQLGAYRMKSEEFFAVTDKMLYHAKQNGKNQCWAG